MSKQPPPAPTASAIIQTSRTPRHWKFTQHLCTTRPPPKEKRNLKFSSDISETYNQPFSLLELKDALSKAHDSFPGPDDIHYQFLKHLPDTSLSVLLKTFNDIWETGNVPMSWREATIIPIPKPGKDNTNPNNYHPIALTSCIC